MNDPQRAVRAAACAGGPANATNVTAASAAPAAALRPRATGIVVMVFLRVSGGSSGWPATRRAGTADVEEVAGRASTPGGAGRTRGAQRRGAARRGGLVARSCRMRGGSSDVGGDRERRRAGAEGDGVELRLGGVEASGAAGSGRTAPAAADPVRGPAGGPSLVIMQVVRDVDDAK